MLNILLISINTNVSKRKIQFDEVIFKISIDPLFSGCMDGRCYVFDLHYKLSHVQIIEKLHNKYEFEGSIEAITWLKPTNNIEYNFIISVRSSNYLNYYCIDETHINNNDKHLYPYLKCNINAFGDDHISYCIGDLSISKTDIMVKDSEEQLRTVLLGGSRISNEQ